MLELRGQVGGDEVWPGIGIGDHQNLGRPRDAVDADRAEHLALGQGHVDVARSRDHVDARDGRGAEGHRRHRLRSAHSIDGVDAGNVRRGEDRRRDGAVRAWRRGQHDLLHARHAGRDGGHQDGRRIRGAAARRIQPRDLGLVELADPLRSKLEGRAIGRGKSLRRRFELA